MINNNIGDDDNDNDNKRNNYIYYVGGGLIFAVGLGCLIYYLCKWLNN